jgi:type I restriction enzyme, S subunit
MDLESFNAGSAVPTLNRNHVHAHTTLLPPRELVERFEVTIQPLFQKVNRNTAHAATLGKLRDTLLPKLMSGEVRVAY